MPVRIPVDETITFRDQTFVNLDFAREYLLFAPPCWPRWLFQARGLGRGGLPLVVSLHGASMDARLFAKQWRYYWEAWVDPETRAAVDLEDQFFVLVPAGTHTVDAPLGGRPVRAPVRRQAAVERGSGGGRRPPGRRGVRPEDGGARGAVAPARGV
jgi:hypothetical protein